MRDITFADAVGFPINRVEKVGYVRNLIERNIGLWALAWSFQAYSGIPQRYLFFWQAGIAISGETPGY